MIPNQKLSIYLKRYYSYHQIKDAESDKIIDIITDKYVKRKFCSL